jgi:hypothetical protein
MLFAYSTHFFRIAQVQILVAIQKASTLNKNPPKFRPFDFYFFVYLNKIPFNIIAEIIPSIA